jgi:hypothetical protein
MFSPMIGVVGQGLLASPDTVQVQNEEIKQAILGNIGELPNAKPLCIDQLWKHKYFQSPGRVQMLQPNNPSHFFFKLS